METVTNEKLDTILSYLKENNYIDIYGDNALLLYALTLRFAGLDMASASEYLTDGSNDKKIDLIYVNTDDKIAIVAQSYMSQNTNKISAKANKASDLNSGISWILNSNEDDLPEDLLAASRQLRESINNGQITQLEIWYVHNLPESYDVQQELSSVVNTTNSVLNSDYSSSEVQVSSIEVGKSRLSEWYQAIHNKISVTKNFVLNIEGGFESHNSDDKWKTFMTSVPLSFLYQIYETHQDSLFSANVREYLGSRRGSSNINTGIKDSVEKSPEDFLIYNNGITLLTDTYHYDKDKNELSLEGISIINGAQTTGAIASVNKEPENGHVFARIVQINDNKVLDKVIEYNNKQNAMNPADFRSNDPIQKRLRKEFEDISFADYSGGRRGGNGDVIKRNSKLFNSNTIAQVLTAFMGNPIGAYQSSKTLWENNSSYNLIFNDLTNKDNILFLYCLYVEIQNIKQDLITQEKKSTEENSETGFSERDSNSLKFLRVRGSTWLIISAISSILPDLLKKKVANKQFIHFKNLQSIQEGADFWNPLIKFSLPLAYDPLMPVLNAGLKNRSVTEKAISNFSNIFISVLSIVDYQNGDLTEFIEHTVISSTE